MLESEGVDLNSCRICLTNKKQLCPLFRYKVSGNYAEMLTAIADVKVAANDGLPDKICTKCCTILEKAYLLKTVAERSDRKLRKLVAKGKLNVPTKKIAFDSFTDIKSEIPFSIKPEPKWEMEIDLSHSNKETESAGTELKDLVIANTVIRKVDLNADDPELKLNDKTDTVDLTWTKTTANNTESDVEFLDEPFQDDDNDADYVPPVEKVKKVKRVKVEPKLKGQYQGHKVIRRIKVLRNIKDDFDSGTNSQSSRREDGKKSTTITCYPIMKNGSRGAPILLKRPKDATILKVHSGAFKRSADAKSVNIKREKPIKIIRTAAPKQKEKMVCPVCGILTFTLGNHIATHEEKKKYTCSHCPKTFTQKSNLLTHAKQHTGVKDHICEICGAGFYSQKSLVRHNLIHKGERPYGCNLCNKRFIARCDLNRHLRIHSGYKPFKCNTCAMSFNAKHQLQNHERMHTGERPYACQVCNVAFSYKVNLNNHVSKVHGINLKFKSIHVVTEDVLRREMGMVSETRAAIAHIIPQLGEVPTPGAHETVPHHTSDY